MFVQSKATKGSEFRAKFPAFNGSLQRPRFAVNEKSLSIPFLNNGVATFFAEKLLGVAHKISKEEQADRYHVVVIAIRYLMYL